MGDKPGHPFRGNQYETFYHGTSEENLKRIMSEGIVPGGAGSNWSETRSGVVYATTSRADAEKFASAAAYNQATEAKLAKLKRRPKGEGP